MNESTIRSRWNEMKGRAKARWRRLTDESLYRIEGRDDDVVHNIERRYRQAGKNAWRSGTPGKGHGDER